MCPGGSTTWPGSLASSVAAPAEQPRMVSAPRYSACSTTAGMPCGARRRCSGRRPPVAASADRRGQHGTVGAGQHHAVGAPFQREQVHRRGADEAGGEARGRPRVHLGGRRVLFDPAVAQQHDLVGHAHGLGLIVRHVQHGDAEAALQRQDLPPHVGAQLRVEVRQRLIHQADRRLGHDGAPQCDALLLAAGKLGRACGRADAPMPRISTARCQPARPFRRPGRGAPSGRTRCSPRRSDAGTARRIGTPSRRRAPRAAGPVTSRPPISTRPAVAVSSPATIRRQVVLPQPDGPSRTVKEPAGTVREMRSSACVAPQARLTPVRRIAAPVAPGTVARPETDSGPIAAKSRHPVPRCVPFVGGTQWVSSRATAAVVVCQFDETSSEPMTSQVMPRRSARAPRSTGSPTTA